MRISIICHVYPPEHAPAGFMVRELAEDLVRRGHSVTILTGWPNHPQGVLYTGWKSSLRSSEYVSCEGGRYQVIRCCHSIHPRNRMVWRLWYYLTFGLSTFGAGLFAGRFDAVLCLSTPIFGSWSAWLLAKLKRARFVYSVFDLHPESACNAGLVAESSWVYKGLRWQDTLLIRWSSVITTLSPSLREAIVARNIPENRIHVIPFWLDPNRITPGNRLNAWRRRHGIPDNTFVALYAGTIGYISGAGILVETAKQLCDRPDILILCVGEGVAKGELEIHAQENGLKNIRFLNFQSEEDLPDMQATADVGLITLLPEASKSSLPSKVLGYLAAGRPVIASLAADSDTATLINDAECGNCVPCQDAVALAKSILYMADQPQLCRQLGENARQHLITNFSRKSCVTQYEYVLTVK